MKSASPLRSPWRWLGLVTSIGLLSWLLRELPVNEVDLGERLVGDWRSLVPPLLAVLVALWLRRLVMALASAVAVGALLAFGPGPGFLVEGAQAFVIGPISDDFNLRIIAFTLVLVGMVRVMSRSGGNAGIVARIVRRARDLRSTRLAAGIMGIVFFFDDYANTVVVGTTMRPLTDRMRIAREKLAYIVDSTAAPVAGLAVISTWVAFEVGLFQQISEQEALGVDGYAFLLSVLPFRFYCFAALLFVFVGILSRRDFGPMWHAERRALHTGALWASTARPLLGQDMQDEVAGAQRTPRARNAIFPIVAVVLGVLGGTLWEAREAIAEAVAAGEATWNPLGMAVWQIGFGEADSARVLLGAALLGTAVAVALALRSGVAPRDAGGAWVRGAWSMRQAILILVLAWGIKEVCDALGTSGYLIALMGDQVPLAVLPVVTFLLASVIAFATGTSWGTMGILLPVVLPLAVALGALPGGESALLLFLVGAAVLDGAIFGDHVSPISDTTVLSSTACGCDHIDHVRTQAPYALCAMILAGGIGYGGVAAGLPLLIALPAILLGVVATFLLVGRPVATRAEEEALLRDAGSVQ